MRRSRAQYQKDPYKTYIPALIALGRSLCKGNCQVRYAFLVYQTGLGMLEHGGMFLQNTYSANIL